MNFPQDFINKLQEMNSLLDGLTDDERVEAMGIVTAGYCHLCGSKESPCYCWNDD